MDDRGGYERPIKPHPKQNAGCLSRILMCWVIPVFCKKGKKPTDGVEDLPDPLQEHKSQVLGDKVERKIYQSVRKSAKKKRKKPSSLVRILWRCFGLEYMMYGFLLVLEELCFRIGSLVFLGMFLDYFMPHSEVPLEHAYLYAGGIVVCSVLLPLLLHPMWMGCYTIGMKMRVALSTLIYRKVLRLRRSVLTDLGLTVGDILTMLSNDATRLEQTGGHFHFCWLGPFIMALTGFLMWREVGIACLSGIGVVLAAIPILGSFMKLISSLRRKVVGRSATRVKLLNEIISALEIIKLYAWEEPFLERGFQARRNEVKPVRQMAFIHGVMRSMAMFYTALTLYVTAVTYILMGHTLTARKVFLVGGYLDILRTIVGVMLSGAVVQISEGIVSVKRIQYFLFCNEESSAPQEENNLVSTSEYIVQLSDVIASWYHLSENPTLQSINIQIKQGSLVAIIGSNGSGKSSLLQVILRELIPTRGTCHIWGRVSYASQEYWVFPGSVRQNIQFNNEFDRRKYDEVLKVCALKRDIAGFPQRDLTKVGERGTSLSGGQKARINLARAVYNEADIYVMDEPLAAVDTIIANHLVEECIKSYLQTKTRIIVTHQLQFVRDMDHIICLKNGKIQFQGTYEEIESSGFLEELTKQHETDNMSNIVSEPTSQVNLVPSFIVPATWIGSDPMVKSSVRILIPVQTSFEYITLPVERYDEDKLRDYLEEFKMHDGFKCSMYAKYFGAGGNVCFIFFVVILFIVSQAALSGQVYWLKFWMQEEEKSTTSNYRREFNTTASVHIYTTLIIFMCFFCIFRMLMFSILCVRASLKLHNKMLNSVIRATKEFLDKTTSGQINTRFTTDLDAIDSILILSMMDCLQIILTFLGSMTVVGLVNPVVLVPIFIEVCIIMLISRSFMATTKKLKRLELISRGPVSTYLSTTLRGLETIRAFGAQEIVTIEFQNHQDVNVTAFYLMLTCGRAFALWVDMLCVLLIACVTYSFFFTNEESASTSSVGVAVTECMFISGSLQWGVRQGVEMELQITSVERVMEYFSIPQEPSLQTSGIIPPADWPARGEIEFTNVNLTYDSGAHGLDNVSFCIMPGEKVGVVGRSGAGKSSLISALFRMVQVEGVITIDNININSVDLKTLRQRLSIIPQEPVLFSGTVRDNLDPHKEFKEAAVKSAIGEVWLSGVLSLDAHVAEGGSNFSVGQKQLICLARAILRNNNILICDEATANIDTVTDQFIQDFVKEKFASCTIVSIAHRLSTVMDYDKILVMDNGRKIEFDHPYNLLKNQVSWFQRLVRESGADVQKELTNMAKKAYKKSLSTSGS